MAPSGRGKRSGIRWSRAMCARSRSSGPVWAHGNEPNEDGAPPAAGPARQQG